MLNYIIFFYQTQNLFEVCKPTIWVEIIRYILAVYEYNAPFLSTVFSDKQASPNILNFLTISLKFLFSRRTHWRLIS